MLQAGRLHELRGKTYPFHQGFQILFPAGSALVEVLEIDVWWIARILRNQFHLAIAIARAPLQDRPGKAPMVYLSHAVLCFTLCVAAIAWVIPLEVSRYAKNEEIW